MYLDLDNVPFYVGKGKGYRYYVSCHLYGNNHNRSLKNKIRKVSVDNIKIHFLHKDISEEEAFYWESYWIKYIGRRDKKEGTLCNLTDGGEGDSGYIISEETKRKIGKANKGHPGVQHTKEARRKISEANKGKKLSEETKRKISKALKGKNSCMYGKTPSEETKRKMSKAHKGKNNHMYGKTPSEETKRKISKALKGYKHSEETKRKMSKAHKGIKIGPYEMRRTGL